MRSPPINPYGPYPPSPSRTLPTPHLPTPHTRPPARPRPHQVLPVNLDLLNHRAKVALQRATAAAAAGGSSAAAAAAEAEGVALLQRCMELDPYDG